MRPHTRQKAPASPGPCGFHPGSAATRESVSADNRIHVWLAELGLPNSRLSLIASSASGQVWRARCPSGGAIVKITLDVRRVLREVEALRRISAAPGVGLPKVISFQVDESAGCAWVAYEDAGLVPIGRCRLRYLSAVAALAAVHTEALGIGGPWPGVERAHTPGTNVILEQVGEVPASEWRRMLRAAGASQTARRTVSRWHGAIRGSADRLLRRMEGMPETVCHGDPHLGNFLWSARERRAYIIDWEYFHWNHPYFDLFQLMDATSPAAPLVRPVSRRRALEAYLSALTRLRSGCGARRLHGRLPPEVAELTGTSSADAWLRGYFRYAALHLLWILLRIDADIASGRWEPESLQRQFLETVRGLCSLSRDFTLSDGRWTR